MFEVTRRVTGLARPTDSAWTIGYLLGTTMRAFFMHARRTLPIRLCHLLLIWISCSVPTLVLSQSDSLRTSEAAAMEFIASMDPQYERPVLMRANQLGKRYQEALFGAESPDGDGRKALLEWQVPSELDDFGDMPAPVVAEFLPIFNLFAKFNSRILSEATADLLVDYPWTAPCAEAFFESISTYTHSERTWRNLVSACSDEARHPNRFFPLVVVLRTVQRLDRQKANSRFQELYPGFMAEVRVAAAPYYDRYGLPAPKADSDSLADVFGAAKERHLQRLRDAGKEDPRRGRASTPGAHAEGGDKALMAQKMPASLIDPLRTSIREFVEVIAKLPSMKVCQALAGGPLDQAALGDLVRERFSSAVQPSVHSGLKMLLRGTSLPLAKLGQVSVSFEPDAPTVNRRDDTRPEIRVGKEVTILCNRSIQAASGFRPLLRRAEAYLESGVTRDQFRTFDLKSVPLPVAVREQAQAIEAANQEMVEALDFLLAHELAHLLLDDPRVTDSMSPFERELRADMLAAAVVESIYPRTMLARMAQFGPARTRTISNWGKEPGAASDPMPGPEALFVLVAKAGYEARRPEFHPPLQERIARLRKALYDLDYWGVR